MYFKTRTYKWVKMVYFRNKKKLVYFYSDYLIFYIYKTLTIKSICIELIKSRFLQSFHTNKQSRHVCINIDLFITAVL